MKRVTILLWVALACTLGVFAQQPNLRITTFGSGGPLDQAAVAVLTSAYLKLGLKLEFINLPGERALQATNNGEYDGELVRKAGLTELYANLIQIKVPVVVSKFVAFALPGTARLGSKWEDLRNARFTYERGTKVIEANTEGFPKAFPVETKIQGFTKLLSHTIDYVVVDELNGLDALRDSNSTKAIVVASGVFAQVPLYHYLNKKHADLAASLEDVLGAE